MRFFFSFVFFFLIIMNLVLDQNVSSFIIMYHLSSLFVIFFGTCGINYRKLVKKQSRKMTELEGKNEVHQLIDRLDLSLIQLGPVESSLQ